MILNNFAEIFLTIYISALGVFGLSHSLPKSNPALYLLMLAFPVGYSLIIIATIFSLLIFSAFLPFFVLFFALFFSAALRYLMKIEPLSSINWSLTVLVIVLYGFISFFFRTINVIVFSFDSFNFIEIAVAFADGVEINNPIYNLLASRPFYIVPAHALVQYFGQDYFSSLSPLFSVCTIAALAYFIMEYPKTPHLKRQLSLVLAIFVVAAAVLTTNFIVQQIFYVNGHTACAYLTTVAAIQILKSQHSSRDITSLKWVDVLLLFNMLMGITFVRLEGLIFVSLLLLFVVEFNLIPTKQLVCGSGFLLVLFAIWTIIFINEGHSFNGFTNNMRALGSLVPIAVLLLVNFVPKWMRQKWSLLQLAIIGILSALLYYAWANPSQYIVSALSILVNTFFDSPWGIFWPALLGVSCLILFSSRDNNNRALLCFIFMYIGLILFLGSLRHAYRINWKDSGNRMFVHLVPLVSYLFLTETIKFFARFRSNQGKVPTEG